MRMPCLALLLLSTGCLPFSAPFHIYDVSAAGPTSPIPCRVKVHFGWQSASITARPPEGEVFTATFAMNPEPPDRSMAALWDRIYGGGYFEAKVLGSRQHFRVTLKGDQGHELQMEVHQPPGLDRSGVEGVAVGSGGRLYKVGY